MSGFGILGSILIGGIAGWIAEKIMKGDHGLLTNIILGILGALVLNWLLVLLTGGTLGGWIGQLVIAVVGACLLIGAWRAIRR